MIFTLCVFSISFSSSSTVADWALLSWRRTRSRENDNGGQTTSNNLGFCICTHLVFARICFLFSFCGRFFLLLIVVISLVLAVVLLVLVLVAVPFFPFTFASGCRGGRVEAVFSPQAAVFLSRLFCMDASQSLGIWEKKKSAHWILKTKLTVLLKVNLPVISAWVEWLTCEALCPPPFYPSWGWSSAQCSCQSHCEESDYTERHHTSLNTFTHWQRRQLSTRLLCWVRHEVNPSITGGVTFTLLYHVILTPTRGRLKVKTQEWRACTSLHRADDKFQSVPSRNEKLMLLSLTQPRETIRQYSLYIYRNSFWCVLIH